QERHTVLDILDVIMASELDPRSLVLEIGEACLTDDGAAVLERFRALGIRIAIDDFGTGSSTLGSLHTPPVDIVKIDGALLRGDDTALTVGIVRLLGALGVATIAEGIERPDQLAMLSEAGCEQGQGFLFSHPVDAGAFEVVRSTSRREAVLSGS
ncbi:MAG TPA: EAL domain-containing protein, partial [Candidatus Dormibacteraeota bacterium]|nr:EAL domain-containing protein [Candidatus Dormibacteraeota bacterium]